MSSRTDWPNIPSGASRCWCAPRRMPATLPGSLRGRAIPFRAVDIEPLQDRPAVRDLVMLISALHHLGDRTAWLAHPARALDGIAAGRSSGDRPCRARDLGCAHRRDLLSDLSADGPPPLRPIAAVLDAAFRVRAQAPLTRWVEQVWLALGGPSVAKGAEDLEQVGAVFARLRQLEQRGPAGCGGSGGEFRGSVRRASWDLRRSEIMTIHKAKGLEFDMVVVPALDRHIPRNRDQFAAVASICSRGPR